VYPPYLFMAQDYITPETIGELSFYLSPRTVRFMDDLPDDLFDEDAPIKDCLWLDLLEIPTVGWRDVRPSQMPPAAAALAIHTK
jgi:hypothetical protein